MTQVWISTGEECYWLWTSLKKSVCTFPPLASCRLSWIDLTGKSGVVPHPNQTPVVSNRRFVPNGCDLHPTTMYLCDCVIMYLYDCVIMYLCNYVFCIQTQCGCFVPNGCDLHPPTLYLCNYVFVQLCILHPNTMCLCSAPWLWPASNNNVFCFARQIGRVTHTWGIPTP